MTKHTNWDYWECDCRKYQSGENERKSYPDDDIDAVHANYVQLLSLVSDLLRSIDSQKKLDEGFTGMGHNILTEKAASKNHHIRQLRKFVEGGCEDA